MQNVIAANKFRIYLALLALCILLSEYRNHLYRERNNRKLEAIERRLERSIQRSIQNYDELRRQYLSTDTCKYGGSK